MQADFIPNLESLETAWWALWRADASATPFQSPAWLIPWARQFCDQAHGALVLREGGELEALVPVFKLDDRWLLCGAGTSDWLDGIFAPDLEPGALAEAIDLLDGPLDLFQLPAGSKLAMLAAGALRPAEPCPALDLPAEIPHNIAQNLAYYRRKAERTGIEPPQLLDAGGIDALVELHTRRWTKAGESGVLRDPHVVAWHRQAAPRLAGAGLLRLYGMRYRNRLVGVLYALSGKRRAHYYLSGFDPEFSSCGLGTILVGHAIAEAAREGNVSFDFLRGREGYKYHWGATDRPSYAAMLGTTRKAAANG